MAPCGLLLALLVCAVTASPVPTLHSPSSSEVETEDSRRVLGSSVVTSVSVIMDLGNGTKAYFADAAGRPVEKPTVASLVGTPGAFLSPDRYEFYTFDESGDLVKKFMTLDQIQSIIAGGDGKPGSSNNIDRIQVEDEDEYQSSASSKMGVRDVVASVQNVLKGELEANKNKVPVPIASPPTAPLSSDPSLDNAAASWGVILPAIMGSPSEQSSQSTESTSLSQQTSEHPTSQLNSNKTTLPQISSEYPAVPSEVPAPSSEDPQVVAHDPTAQTPENLQPVPNVPALEVSTTDLKKKPEATATLSVDNTGIKKKPEIITETSISASYSSSESHETKPLLKIPPPIKPGTQTSVSTEDSSFSSESSQVLDVSGSNEDSSASGTLSDEKTDESLSGISSSVEKVSELPAANDPLVHGIPAQSAASDTNDLKITAPLVASDSTDQKITVPSAASNSTEQKVTATLATSDSTDQKITVPSAASDSTDQKITAPSAISDSSSQNIPVQSIASDPSDQIQESLPQTVSPTDNSNKPLSGGASLESEESSSNDATGLKTGSAESSESSSILQSQIHLLGETSTKDEEPGLLDEDLAIQSIIQELQSAGLSTLIPTEQDEVRNSSSTAKPPATSQEEETLATVDDSVKLSQSQDKPVTSSQRPVTEEAFAAASQVTQGASVSQQLSDDSTTSDYKASSTELPTSPPLKSSPYTELVPDDSYSSYETGSQSFEYDLSTSTEDHSSQEDLDTKTSGSSIHSSHPSKPSSSEELAGSASEETESSSTLIYEHDYYLTSSEEPCEEDKPTVKPSSHPPSSTEPSTPDGDNETPSEKRPEEDTKHEITTDYPDDVTTMKPVDDETVQPTLPTTEIPQPTLSLDLTPPLPDDHSSDEPTNIDVLKIDPPQVDSTKIDTTEPPMPDTTQQPSSESSSENPTTFLPENKDEPKEDAEITTASPPEFTTVKITPEEDQTKKEVTEQPKVVTTEVPLDGIVNLKPGSYDLDTTDDDAVPRPSHNAAIKQEKPATSSEIERPSIEDQSIPDLSQELADSLSSVLSQIAEQPGVLNAESDSTTALPTEDIDKQNVVTQTTTLPSVNSDSSTYDTRLNQSPTTTEIEEESTLKTDSMTSDKNGDGNVAEIEKDIQKEGLINSDGSLVKRQEEKKPDAASSITDKPTPPEKADASTTSTTPSTTTQKVKFTNSPIVYEDADTYNAYGALTQDNPKKPGNNAPPALVKTVVNSSPGQSAVLLPEIYPGNDKEGTDIVNDSHDDVDTTIVKENPLLAKPNSKKEVDEEDAPSAEWPKPSLIELPPLEDSTSQYNIPESDDVKEDKIETTFQPTTESDVTDTVPALVFKNSQLPVTETVEDVVATTVTPGESDITERDYVTEVDTTEQTTDGAKTDIDITTDAQLQTNNFVKSAVPESTEETISGTTLLIEESYTTETEPAGTRPEQIAENLVKNDGQKYSSETEKETSAVIVPATVDEEPTATEISDANAETQAVEDQTKDSVTDSMMDTSTIMEQLGDTTTVKTQELQKPPEDQNKLKTPPGEKYSETPAVELQPPVVEQINYFDAAVPSSPVGQIISESSTPAKINIPDASLIASPTNEEIIQDDSTPAKVNIPSETLNAQQTNSLPDVTSNGSLLADGQVSEAVPMPPKVIIPEQILGISPTSDQAIPMPPKIIISEPIQSALPSSGGGSQAVPMPPKVIIPEQTLSASPTSDQDSLAVPTPPKTIVPEETLSTSTTTGPTNQEVSTPPKSNNPDVSLNVPPSSEETLHGSSTAGENSNQNILGFDQNNKLQTPTVDQDSHVRPTSPHLSGTDLTKFGVPEHNNFDSRPPPSRPQFDTNFQPPPPPIELGPAPNENLGLEVTTVGLSKDVRKFTDLCNELAFKLWSSIAIRSLNTARSVVMSPIGLTSILAMVFLGARGPTSGQMNDILGLDDMITFNPHLVFRNVTESVVLTRSPGVAAAAFVRQLYSDRTKGKLLDFYKERAQQFYDGHVEEVNFNMISDVLRRRTNLLVKRQTRGKIPEYLRGSNIMLHAPLAAFSANIFQTDCSEASTDGRNGEMYFTVLPSTRQRRLVPVPAAVWRSGFLAGYEPSLDATAVALGGTESSLVSVILILPGQQGHLALGDSLAQLEKRLIEPSYRRGAWSRLLRCMSPRPGLEVQIPRFSHRSLLNMTGALQRMGLKDLFMAERADLRGLNGVANDLHLSDIVQVNTFSTCAEDSVSTRHHTEIYPSSPQQGRTGRDRDTHPDFSSVPLALRPRQARVPDAPRLRFDRPFLYVVRHNPTGFLLHMGRFNPHLLH